MNYNRGDVVILPFPFVTAEGVTQKARPALVISDHTIRRRFNDVILVGITSRRTHDVHDTELLIEERDPEFDETGLVKTSVVRCEYVMTIPGDMIVRKLGCFSLRLMAATDDKLRLSLGL